MTVPANYGTEYSGNTTNSTTSTATSTSSSGGRSIVYTKLPVNHLNVIV